MTAATTPPNPLDTSAPDAGGAQDPSQINRATVTVLLGIAIAFTLAVLFGARYVFNRAADQPVAMAEVPAPDAGSAECADFVANLPKKVLGYKRAELAEPAPAGAAAWQRSSTQRVTLRCGVDMPLQYNAYSQTLQAGGATWVRVNDTPGSTMATWFTTDRAPVVAVTADAEQLGRRESPVEEIDAARLPHEDHQPAPAPLTQLAAGDTSACDGFRASAPESIGEGYSLLDASADPVKDPFTVVWTAPGSEPVVARCGVAAPANYRAGAQLAQVNGLPWFEDTEAGNGVTADTWYALGLPAVVAASIPATGGNEVVTNLSDFVSGAVVKRDAP